MLILALKVSAVALVAGGFKSSGDQMAVHLLQQPYKVDIDGHEFEQALAVGDEQGSLACCSPWGCRVGHD